MTKSSPEPLNHKLPHEILWTIFEHYAKADGIDNPLEKLLAICRNWSLAACQYKDLWSSFRINVTSNEILHFWSSRITRRLELGGEDGRIDVDIVAYQIFKSQIIDETLLLKISLLLIGQGGSMSKRWRHLSIVNMHPVRAINLTWNQALCYPTPNLRLLRLHGLNFEKPILPLAPFLEEVDICNSHLQVACACEQLETIKLRGNGVKIGNIEMMVLPTKLTTLEVVYYTELHRLPTHFPVLQNASFVGPLDNSVIQKFSMPRLRSLSLFPNSNDSFSAFINCREIDFQQIETIGLGLRRQMEFWAEKKAAREIIQKVINSAPIVKRIRALTQSVAEIVLDCLEDGRIQLGNRVPGCEIELKYYNTNGRLIEGNFGIHGSTRESDILRVRTFCRQNA
jgi:hypothetical protein